MNTPPKRNRNLHLERVQEQCTPIRIPLSPQMQNLGYGTGVNVYRLERSPNAGGITRSPWAVKRVSQRNASNEKNIFNERILAEANILRKLSHPNIIGYRGITKSENGVDTLVLECCGVSLGSILEDRYEFNLGPLPAANILKMIEDISHALDYLHNEAKLLHGDLKSFNVLVKDNFKICKLCDFGVSLPLDDNGVIDMSKNPKLCYVGTDIWSAPEIMDERDVIDYKADIFSFGLVIYETITLHPPHTVPLKDDEDMSVVEQERNESDILTELSDDGEIRIPIIKGCGTRPPLPCAFDLKDDYNLIVELFYHCTAELAEDRPTARTIWLSIEELKTEEGKLKHENNNENEDADSNENVKEEDNKKDATEDELDKENININLLKLSDK